MNTATAIAALQLCYEQDGAASNGAAPDGAAPDGVASDGAAPDGVAPDGAAPDGAASDGAASDGATPDDISIWVDPMPNEPHSSIPKAEWDRIRPPLVELYWGKSLPLEVIRATMKRTYNFEAT